MFQCTLQIGKSNENHMLAQVINAIATVVGVCETISLQRDPAGLISLRHQTNAPSPPTVARVHGTALINQCGTCAYT